MRLVFRHIRNLHRIDGRRNRLDQDLIRVGFGLLKVIDDCERRAGLFNADALHLYLNGMMDIRRMG